MGQCSAVAARCPAARSRPRRCAPWTGRIPGRGRWCSQVRGDARRGVTVRKGCRRWRRMVCRRRCIGGQGRCGTLQSLQLGFPAGFGLGHRLFGHQQLLGVYALGPGVQLPRLQARQLEGDALHLGVFEPDLAVTPRYVLVLGLEGGMLGRQRRAPARSPQASPLPPSRACGLSIGRSSSSPRPALCSWTCSQYPRPA